MLQSFKMALKSIWGNKMRSFLTMLGIIIGVASVIILVSIVNGYMSYMTESFASMGVNKITVITGPCHQGPLMWRSFTNFMRRIRICSRE